MATSQWMMGTGWFQDQGELLVPKLLNRRRDSVTGLEPDLLVLRITCDNTLRGTGEDHVPRFERHMLREICNLLSHVENHAAGVGRLPDLPVDLRLDIEVLGIDLVRTD